MKIKELPFNLQFFAEESEGIENNVSAEQDNQSDNKQEEVITLTKEEFEKEKQREADRRVQQALEKERQKLKEMMREEIERERKEAEELAKLSERERQKRELEKEREKLEQEKRAFYRERLKLQAEQELLNRGLPTVIASYILGEDAEETLKTIEEVEETWKKALEEEVNKRLATDVPKVGTGNATVKNPFTKEHFNLTEQGKIIRENPERARQLITAAGKDPKNYGL